MCKRIKLDPFDWGPSGIATEELRRQFLIINQPVMNEMHPWKPQWVAVTGDESRGVNLLSLRFTAWQERPEVFLLPVFVWPTFLSSLCKQAVLPVWQARGRRRRKGTHLVPRLYYTIRLDYTRHVSGLWNGITPNSSHLSSVINHHGIGETVKKVWLTDTLCKICSISSLHVKKYLTEKSECHETPYNMFWHI